MSHMRRKEKRDREMRYNRLGVKKEGYNESRMVDKMIKMLIITIVVMMTIFDVIRYVPTAAMRSDRTDPAREWSTCFL